MPCCGCACISLVTLWSMFPGLQRLLGVPICDRCSQSPAGAVMHQDHWGHHCSQEMAAAVTWQAGITGPGKQTDGGHESISTGLMGITHFVILYLCSCLSCSFLYSTYTELTQNKTEQILDLYWTLCRNIWKKSSNTQNLSDAVWGLGGTIFFIQFNAYLLHMAPSHCAQIPGDIHTVSSAN